LEAAENSGDRVERKSPEEIIHLLMENLSSQQKTTDQVAKAINSSWGTTWGYLNLIVWVQSCPKVIKDRLGKSDTWKREWGRIP